MSDTIATPSVVPAAPVAPAAAPVAPAGAPVAPAQSEPTQRTLTERAEAIVSALEGLAYHDAVIVMNYVAERISSGVSREVSIVKTKFEEALLWVRRHVEVKTIEKAISEQSGTAPAPAAPEGQG